MTLQATYERVMAGNMEPGLFTAHEKFTVRLWDGMDGCWCDCLNGTDVSKDEALKVWADRTKNGTEKTKYADIDYYAIFPAETRMIWSGVNEMFR